MMAELLSTAELESLRTLRQLTVRPEGELRLMQAASGRRVMLKMMPTPWMAFRQRQIFVQRLRQIMRISHPHLVPIHGGRIRGAQCLVVTDEWHRGSLLDAISPGDRRHWTLPMAPREAMRLVAEAAEGVAALHARQEMHGGIKLTNILLMPYADGQTHAAVTDSLLHLGLMGFTTPSFLRRPVGLGDPLLFIAPEQLAGHAVPASDQFALALVAFILLTGMPPFSGDPLLWLRDRASRPLPAASQLNPALPPTVDGVLEHALHRSPRSRFRSVQEFALALRQAVQIPEVARSMSLELATEAIPGRPATPGPLREVQAHETLEPPQPLATLRQDSDPPTPGLPGLPPNYGWTAEVLASVPAHAAPSSVVTRRPLTTWVTYSLFAAVIVIALLMMCLLAVFALAPR